MPSRSTRRRQNKALARKAEAAAAQTVAAYTAEITRQLDIWREQARQRAAVLGPSAAWELFNNSVVRERLRRLDQTGTLLAELQRVITEVVEEVTDS